MTDAPKTREIAAPHSFLFGQGVVLISRGLESANKERAQLILRECWEHPVGQVGGYTPEDHPLRFDSPEPQFAPEGTVSLIFHNPEGLENLNRELVTLHHQRYPTRPLNVSPKECIPEEAAVFSKFAQVAQ